MIRFKMILSYNGANYHGWQTQRKGNSIQEQVENVLSSIHGECVEVHASGRTDSKVHALAQVVHFDSNVSMSGDAYKNACNALLPKDIRVVRVEAVDQEFHARFQTISKRYDYYLSRDMDNPFIQNFMGKDSMKLDYELMRECSKIFIGEHDFTSFTSSKIDPRKSRIKTISKIDIVEEGLTTHFILEGSGFLRYMVRMIVQTMIEVGKHKVSVDEVRIMLEGKDKHLCKYKADAQGLYLVSVNYEMKES